MENPHVNTGDGRAEESATNFIEKNKMELHDAINKTIDTAKPTVDNIAANAHKAVDQVSNTISEVSSTVADSSEILMDAFKNYVDRGLTPIRANPVTSTMIALAVGYGLSKFLGAQYRDR